MMLSTYFSRAALIRRTISIFAAGSLLAGTAACGGDDDKDPTGTGGNSAAGSYSIVSVTGPDGTDTSAPFTALTGTIEDEGQVYEFRIDVAGGTIALRADNTYSATVNMKLYVEGQEQTGFFDNAPTTGTYAVSGNTITFTDSDGEVSTATLSDGRITRSEELDLNEDGQTDATISIVAAK